MLYDEINTGWGYIVFLTAIIARKFSFEFKKYELIPMGNYSKIVNRTTKVIYELYINIIQNII